MISREVLVDQLRSHSRKLGSRDLRTHCLCGWASDQRPSRLGQHVEHQADMLLEALYRWKIKDLPPAQRRWAVEQYRQGLTPNGDPPSSVDPGP